MKSRVEIEERISRLEEEMRRYEVFMGRNDWAESYRLIWERRASEILMLQWVLDD